MTIPSVTTNVLGYGAFLGLYANLRYQLLCGIDRAMFGHFDVLRVVTVFRTALRQVYIPSYAVRILFLLNFALSYLSLLSFPEMLLVYYCVCDVKTVIGSR